MTRMLFLVGSFFLSAIVPLKAGIYNSIDTLEETQEYANNMNRFREVLTTWKLIGLSDEDFVKWQEERKLETGMLPPESRLRKRYKLIQLVGEQSDPTLASAELQLNYSAVLIRRGKLLAAQKVLENLCDREPKNFIARSQRAMMYYLNHEFGLARDEQREALLAWPEDYGQVDAEQKKLLTSLGFDHEETYYRFRRVEVCLLRLMENRYAEWRRAKKAAVEPKKEDRPKRIRDAEPEPKKEVVVESVDPIFGDAKDPVRFVMENGKFEVGRIADVDYRRLPKDAVQTVKQLLIWMPHDNRLLWLLAEVSNAAAMGEQDADNKNDALRDAFSTFDLIAKSQRKRSDVYYGKQQIEERIALMKPIVEQLPPRRPKLDKDLVVPPDGDPSILSNEQFWRTLIVSFIMGFAVGLFALWQVQEMRRRRQARA